MIFIGMGWNLESDKTSRSDETVVVVVVKTSFSEKAKETFKLQNQILIYRKWNTRISSRGRPGSVM